MPGLKRVCLAAAAVALLAAIAGGQQASPFRQPPRMPPEIMPGNGAPAIATSPHLRMFVELDNAQMRVVRYRLEAREILNLPDGSPGRLIVALGPLEVGTLSLRSGQTRWIPPDSSVSNPGARVCEFLLIEPKRN
jgi:hypothetical protein